MGEIQVRRWAAIIFVLLALVVGGLIGTLATAKTNRGIPLYVNPPASSGGARISFEEGFAPVVEKSLPSVVNISSTKVVKVPGGNPNPFFEDPFFRQFFGRGFGRQQAPQQEREHSLGSGVIVRSDGYILTNNHVVDGASDITIGLPDRRVFKGKIVGADSKTDIAVVKISQSNLPAMPIGDSAKVRTGQFVLAIGDPFDIGETVTMGIVSATGRGGLGIENYEDFIQTDAAINPGNSGGALIDVNGRLVGVNTAILTGGGNGNAGVGFAIPINMANKVMDQIISKGKVTRGWLGISIQPLNPALAQAFGLQKDEGALVGSVEPDSPAARAGLRQGDVVLALDGKPVVDARALSLAVSQMQPGSTVHLKIIRDNRQQDISATLGEMPVQNERAANQPGRGTASPLQGVSVDNLTPDIARQLNLPSNTHGVVITDIADGSAAAEAGLQSGDVIQEVNHRPVRNVNEFEAAIRQSAGGKPVLLLVNHGGQTGYVAIQP